MQKRRARRGKECNPLKMRGRELKWACPLCFKENRMDEFTMIVEGVMFRDKIMAQKACHEAESIQYVRSKLDMENPRMVLEMYHKLLKENVFETVVGLMYLKELQSYLLMSPELAGEELQAIELPASFAAETVQEETIEWYAQHLEELKQRERTTGFQKRRAEEREKKSRKQLRFSLMCCLFLFLVAAGMGVITLTGSHPNIINYENKIINKYEAWEADLESREQSLKEQQKESGGAP